MAASDPLSPPCPVFPTEHLEAMYPDVYKRVYPVVLQCCEIYDVPSNPGFYPYPTRAAVEQMTDYICQRCSAEMNTPMERQFGGGFLRTLIAILLIRQLLRRRFTFYY